VTADRSPFVHPSAEIHSSVRIGAGTRIWHQAHIRENATIGDDCNISKDVYVDFGVTIGNRVKVQNGVSIYHGVVLEDDTFIGPHVSFTNDAMPRAFSSDWQIVPTYVRRGAAIGANSTVVCGVTLGPYSMVGAGSTVVNDVPPHALVIGSPARVVAYICRRGHKMEANAPVDYSSVYCCKSCGEILRVSYVLDVS
jgi:UDP-2-acetamido-3-amino-2,3-dideoxy-glucuronate N-acetyltransferase